MKKWITGFYVLLFGCVTSVYAQTTNDNGGVPHPVRISISLNKTVTLKFPAPVLSADRGRKEVLLQRAKGTQDVLLLKAADSLIPETNLSVVTSDGGLYSFIVSYAEQPGSLQYVLEEAAGTNNGAGLQRNMELVAQLPARIHKQYVQRHLMRLSLDGIYVKDELLFLQLGVANCSAIDFNTASFSLSIVDRKQARRTARQELVITPLGSYGQSDIVKGRSGQQWVVAVPKFTIPDQKFFSIQLFEENGGRHLQLRVRNRTVMKARALR